MLGSVPPQGYSENRTDGVLPSQPGQEDDDVNENAVTVGLQ